MYNFIGSGGVNVGHPGVFLNAEDQDNYDFIYFRFVAIYTRRRGELSVFWLQTWATIWIFQNLLKTSSVYENDFGVLEMLCEDGECYISWHVFVARLCNKPFNRICLILCIVSFYFPGLIHPADVFRRVTFTKVNQNLTEQSPPLAPTVPPREQNGSTSGWQCRIPHLPGKWRSTWKEHWWRHSTRAIQSENVVVSWLPMVTVTWCITRTLSSRKEVSCVNIKNGFSKQRLNNS